MYHHHHTHHTTIAMHTQVALIKSDTPQSKTGIKCAELELQSHIYTQTHNTHTHTQHIHLPARLTRQDSASVCTRTMPANAFAYAVPNAPKNIHRNTHSLARQPAQVCGVPRDPHLPRLRQPGANPRAFSEGFSPWVFSCFYIRHDGGQIGGGFDFSPDVRHRNEQRFALAAHTQPSQYIQI